MIPFGLKNARATYQRLVNKMFSKKIGKNMEVYMDNILVKSKESTHLNDLQETFTTFRRYQMKLNPNKYTFGVTLGKFLRFMMSQRGIETQRRCEPY